MVIEVTDSNFESKTSEGVVLIDFWAAWCGPCRMQAPILDELAEDYAGKVQVAKLDVDANPIVPQTFSIMSIPTLVIKKDGQVVEKVTGVHQKAQLVELLDQYV